jgi:signal transduction histidine kinase
MDEKTTVNLEGRLAERIAMRRDITECHRMVQELRRAEHFTLLGQLASTVIHEICNPLNTIFLHLDILEEELRRSRSHRGLPMMAAVAEIRTELTRLYDVVQDSLTLARLASLQREPADLGAFVKAFGLGMLERLTHHSVALHLEGLAHLGPVAIHKSTFHRALFNLVQNALDAMPDGGALSLRGQRTETGIALEISDTGSGIPADDVPLIFTPLYTTKPDSLGLGLYIVQEIVVAHGGAVTVRSAPGTGTTFTITLLCLEAEAQPPDREEQV